MKVIALCVVMSSSAFLGCVKQPIVEAPVVITIPPMPKTAVTDELPLASKEPRLTFSTPPGWEVELRHPESFSLRQRDVVDSFMFARIEEDTSSDSPEQDANQFYNDVNEALARRGINGSSYIFGGDKAVLVVVRHASEVLCGTAVRIKHAGPPSRLIVVNGEWPCETDVDNDAALQTLLQSLKILER